MLRSMMVCLYVCGFLYSEDVEQHIHLPKPKKPVDEPAWVHDKLGDLSGRVWHAKPAVTGTPLTTVQGVRVVDFGDENMFRHEDKKTGQAALASHLGITRISGMDVDGDGVKQEYINYREFNVDVPFNGRPPSYDIEANSAIFYGGSTIFAEKEESGPEEFGINSGEGKNWSYITPDNMGKHSAFAICLWKKEDFRYGGDEHRVSLDETSRFGLHVMRFFWRVTDGRYVVKDGDQYYISEYNWGSLDAQKYWSDVKKYNPVELGLSKHTQGSNGVVYGMSPTETKWAPYNPHAPYHIDFQPEKAMFEKRTFNDVQELGFYFGKNNFENVGMAIKWYAFEVLATVHRPERPSETLDMAEIQIDDASTFYISKTEIPYVLFKRVRRWAVAPQFAFDQFYPFVTENDGDMGSMDYGPDGVLQEHGANEPVTDITWLDAMLWCNMLSEYEGREPVYYFTDDYKYMQRRARVRQWGERRNVLYKPRVYVKWEADGYRLPTSQEWLAAAGNANEAEAWTSSTSNGSTQSVAGKKANEHGLYDMFGNVWEYVWDVGEAYDPSAKGFVAQHTVFGGDFNYPAHPMETLGNPYGDTPHKGHFSIGLRVVRRNAGGTKPSTEIPETINYPTWTISEKDVSKGMSVEQVQGDVLKMLESPESNYKREQDGVNVFVSPGHMAQSEITYAQWKKVRDWAVHMGYVFNYDGDMGSMDFRTWADKKHSPDEPVTGLTRLDVVVWCNALSQMEGRTPCYYQDKIFSKIYKESYQARAFNSRRSNIFDDLAMHLLGWKPSMKKKPGLEQEYQGEDWFNTYGLGSFKRRYGGGMSHPVFAGPVPHVDWSQDGYRIPTFSEWVVACKAQTKTTFHWGNEPDLTGEHAWSWHNSDGKTHGAGQKPANKNGFYDMLGNVHEMCWGRTNMHKNQSKHETWNPKGTVIGTEGGSSHQMQGGSFMDSTIPRSSALAFVAGGGKKLRSRFFISIWNWNSFPNVGFRPIRCKAREHRQSGNELPENILILDVNLADAITPLQGQTDRGNLNRNGVLFSMPITTPPRIKWTFTPEPQARLTTCPLVHRDQVYIGSDNGYLYALNSETGEERWKFKLNEKPPYNEKGTYWGYTYPSAPTIKEGVLYIGSQGPGTARLYALDIETGRTKWSVSSKGAKMVSSAPVPAYGAVFAYLTGYGDESGLIAVHEKTGQLLTLYSNYFWGGWQRSMNFADGTLLAAGKLVDLRSGSIRGETSAGKNTSVIDDGRVYAVGGAAMWTPKIKVSDYRSGKEIYTVELNDENTKYNRVAITENTLALWKDNMYIGTSQGELYCNDTADGTNKWKAPLPTSTVAAPIVATESHASNKAVVYIGCEDGSVCAIDGVTGTVLWTWQAGGRVWMDIWAEEGVLYVASDDGTLTCLKP